MYANSSSTILVSGLAAFGLALVVAGVRLYRRRRAGGTAAGPQDDMQVEAGIGNEEKSLRAELPDDREAHTNMPANASQAKLPLTYFVLAFVLAVPFWVFGGGKLPLPINLPVGALVTFVPMTAAAMLSYQQSGFTGVKELLKKALDYKKIKREFGTCPSWDYRL
jgi:hypothetical protein